MKRLLDVDSSFINTMRGEIQRTPLLITVIYNKLSMVQLFLNHGVDVSLCDKYGANVYHYCTEYDSCEEFLSLLLPHADTNKINKCNDGNRTPLWLASCYGRLEYVRLILSNVNVNINIGKSAYDDACVYDNKENKKEIKRLIRDYKK